MQVSIIIPVYNEYGTIRQTLLCLIDSIRRSGWIYEVIIVDSSPDDRTADVVSGFITESGTPISILRPAGKTYAGRARNLGVAASRYALITFLDAGVYVEPDWFPELARSFRQPDPPDLVWGRSLFKPGNAWERSYVRSFYRQGYTRRFIRSAMMKKEVFNQLGGFIEHVHAGEDLDFYAKVRTLGCHEYFADNAVSWYSHFPQNTRQILQKWIGFTRDNVLAGQAGKKTIFVAIEVLLLLLCAGVCLTAGMVWGTGAFLVLAVARCAFQFNKAGIRIRHPGEIALTVYLIAVFDLTRFLGVMYGWICMWTGRTAA